MAAVALGLLAAAHLFDYVTFLLMTARHGLAAEYNPLVVQLAQQYGLPGLTLAKVGSVLFLTVAIVLLAPRRRHAAVGLLVVGVAAGVIGGVSNIASI